MAKINKCIELLAQGQPLYATHPSRLTYEAGLADAKTWADMLLIDFEHQPFDTIGLTHYMRGLKAGGPTVSGHPTPTVVCTLPCNAITLEEVRYNAWQHPANEIWGLSTAEYRCPEKFCPMLALESPRGNPVQNFSGKLYARLADPWPLNPDGELLLGLKIEDRYCLPNVDAIAAVPRIGFAEWGPGDMGRG